MSAVAPMQGYYWRGQRGLAVPRAADGDPSRELRGCWCFPTDGNPVSWVELMSNEALREESRGPCSHLHLGGKGQEPVAGEGGMPIGLGRGVPVKS